MFQEPTKLFIAGPELHLNNKGRKENKEILLSSLHFSTVLIKCDIDSVYLFIFHIHRFISTINSHNSFNPGADNWTANMLFCSQ